MAWIGGEFKWAEKHGYTTRSGNSNGLKKIKGAGKKPNYPLVPKIKWVKRAGCYCKTWFEEGKQKQSWSVEYPD